MPLLGRLADRGPCYRFQMSRSLWFPLLLLGNEVMSAAFASSSKARVVDERSRSEAHSRSLAELQPVGGWSWPPNTSLTLKSDAKATASAASSIKMETSQTEVKLLAGQVYESIEIQAPGAAFTQHTAPKINLVTSMADRTTCHLDQYNVSVGLVSRQYGANRRRHVFKDGYGVMGDRHGPLALTKAGDKLTATTGSPSTVPPGRLVFMQGGLFQLCYTPDGRFDSYAEKNNVLLVKVKVIGVMSPCTFANAIEDGCMEEERWECSFSFKGENPSACDFNLKADGGRKGWGITPGSKSKMTWTAAVDSTGGGSLSICSDSVPEQSALDTSSTGLFLQLDGKVDPTSMPPVKANWRKSAFTVGACYCPNYDKDTSTYCGTETSTCCDDYQEYIQPFGIIYYWTITICDKENYMRTTPTGALRACSPPYMRVVPQQKFVTRVDCPPGGGCKASSNNRIKYIDHTEDNDRPTWDLSHGCRNSIFVSEQTSWKATESSKAIWLPSPSGTPYAFDGGSSTVFKSWHANQVKFNSGLRKASRSGLDVCYCNENCEWKEGDVPSTLKNQKNWFRIGTIFTTDQFAFATTSLAGGMKMLKYVNEAGSVTFYGGITTSDVGAEASPYDSNMYSGRALVNMFSYDRDTLYNDDYTGGFVSLEKKRGYDVDMPTGFQIQMDSECKREFYPQSLITPADGTWSKVGSAKYVAQVAHGDDEAVSRHLTFNGVGRNLTLSIARAGIVGICYCALLTEQDLCADRSYWLFAGRVTIHGPVGGQSWIFPTHVAVNVELHGWGFTNKDKLRIIPSTGSCSAATPPDGDESFKYGCPDEQPARLSDQGCVFAKRTDSIPLYVLSSLSTEIFINAVSSSATQSSISFTKSIKRVLNTGDTITIDTSRIENNGKTLNVMTDLEKFDAYSLSGTTPFQDNVAKSFMVGHKVQGVKDSNGVVNDQQLSIPLGWPSNAMPAFSFTNKQGHWTRHNRIQSARLIKGVAPKDGLKACWGVTDGLTKYYAEAGTVSFQDPPVMKTGKISLSTKQSKAIAPVIISFTTSPMASAYTVAKNAATSLMLRFTDAARVNGREAETGKLIPMYAGDTPPDVNEVPVKTGTKYPSSTLNVDAAAGAKEIMVSSQVGFEIGMTVDIDPGTAVYEAKRISAIGAGLNLDSKLVFNHTVASQVTTQAPLNVFAPADEVLEQDKRQWVCGKLFKELWSDDSEGFPMPTGCYFTKKLRDLPERGINTNFFRELYLVFPPGSGLKQNTSYQMVVNAQVTNIGKGDHLLDLYSLCVGPTGCARPYQVFEKGMTQASSATEMAGSAANDPSFNQHGFMIQGGHPMDGVFDLRSRETLHLKLRGMEESGAIAQNSILRVFFWPLTLWELGSECFATCHPYPGTACGTPTCSQEEAVLGSGRKNIVKMKLPAGMTDITGTTRHTVMLTGLALPLSGFFASRVGAQVTRDDDSRPSYMASYGFLFKTAGFSQTTGRLVLDGRTGYGPKPFEGNTSNTLYVRIQFGATVWNNGQADAASLVLTLPDGYTCNVLDDGKPDLSLPVFTNDLNGDGYYDSNRGHLAVNPADGNWANSAGKYCIYEPAQHMTLFAGTVVFVKLTVDNPSMPMHKTDGKNNVWSIKLSSKGSNIINPASSSMPNQSFITLKEETELIGNDNVTYWGGNAAVLSTLLHQNIQPTDFSLSTVTLPVYQFVHVFFKTTQHVGRNGYVIVDAPVGYDFGAACVTQDLPRKYYAYRGHTQNQVYRLTSMENQCFGFRSPATATAHNRARIRVGGIIGRDMYYGFMVKVKHPTVYEASQHTDWYIFTQDSKGYGLEGTISTVKFNKPQAPSQMFYNKAYGMYSGDFFDEFHIEIKGTQPFSISNAQSIVVVYPLTFSRFLDTSLRITAPAGYEWVSGAGSFISKMNMSTIEFPGAPVVENENQIVWPVVQFSSDQTYGFEQRIKVPDFGPVTSSDNFFVEFGYNKANIGARLMAAVLPAPRIAAITNAAVSYGSNLMGYNTNWIEFRFEIVTLLWENEGIVIKGDKNTAGFQFVCNVKLLPGSAKFPADSKCISVAADDSLPQIVFKAQATPIQPGYYKLELPVTNPLGKVSTAGWWKFGSYKRVMEYGAQPSIPSLDAELWAAGFRINTPILDARVITLNAKQHAATQRNDRPSKANQLIFRFQLRVTPQSEGPLKLRGPRGFEFTEDCLKDVVTSKNEVFGPDSEAEWPGDLTTWPDQVAPTACIGEGRFATMTLPKGLSQRNMYVFRIGVSNPATTPAWNKWTIDYQDESSEPFEGFTVWTQTNCKVTPVSLAISPANKNLWRANPVEILFTPYKQLAVGGVIRVTTPTGFKVVQDSKGACNVVLFETRVGPTSAFPKTDLQCKVSTSPSPPSKNRRLAMALLVSKLWLEIIGGNRMIESGKPGGYTMIVQVYNPTAKGAEENWAVDSFRSKVSSEIQLDKITPEEEANLDAVALDESIIIGKATHKVLTEWTVVNKVGRLNGLNQVNDVVISMQFPDDLRDNDELMVYAPKEFDITGNPELADCKEFRWETTNPFDSTKSPTCGCASGLCWMRFYIQEYKDPAFVSSAPPIMFAIATQNPAKTPFITSNFWKAEHRRGDVILSSNIIQSWDIKPQLEDVTIDLVGLHQRAGSTSDIRLSFKPVLDAGTITIEAAFPLDFDFGDSTVFAPFLKDDQSEREFIIINNAAIIASIPKTIEISGVKLGRGGGQTIFNLITYIDHLMTVKCDEKLLYDSGFMLPGKVVVTSTSLKSKYQHAEASYPIKSLFRPRVSELGVAEFTMMFSQSVSAVQSLYITCLGTGAYEVRSDPFQLVGKERIDTLVARTPGKLNELTVVLKPGRPNTEIALQADMPYTLVFWVIPRHGPNNWRIMTSQGGQYPTNTNDGITEGFQPVEQMSLTVSAPRSPPRSIIKVTLNVRPGIAAVYKLLVIVPPAFQFAENDLGQPLGCGTMCITGEPLGSTSRRTATIQSPTGEPLTDFHNIEIIVQTPEETPAGAQSWFVEALGIGGATTTGWGEGPGFRVQQMVSGVSYAGVSSLHRAQISFHFTLETDSGSEIEVEPPTNYFLRCSSEGALRQGSLPGTRPGCTDTPLALKLTTTLTRGQYSFAVDVDLPAQKSVPNNFNIIIRDKDRKVVDAAYALEGVELIQLPVTSPSFSWSSATPGQSSIITIGITFTSDLNLVMAILVNFPAKFAQAVKRPMDVVNHNPLLPLAYDRSGGWADWLQDNLKIYTTGANIVRGTYSWSFPVRVPGDSVPKINVWYFSVCIHDTCAVPNGQGTIVSFPMQGFVLGEISSESLRIATSSAPPLALRLGSFTASYALSVLFALGVACQPGL